ncbi:hypothetical protein FRY98_26850 [Paenibacillus faecis]|uniref:Uncharacterized protein n=1 Tax=Paenibacillus faecis TaxID=862114 RepID=A0A5D0CNH8_9BACL|nr:hypothetical protein [Paenibacillus faecis]TYA10207.1 hypothetical protein FRY98_26850 [Paenibacillus faecis]
MKTLFTSYYAETMFNETHPSSQDWRECENNELLAGLYEAYLEPIMSSFYVPRLVRIILKGGGTVLT